MNNINSPREMGMSGGRVHRPRGTQSIPSHWVSVLCVPVLAHGAVLSMLCHMATDSDPFRIFFKESPCGPDFLAKTERQRETPPTWARRRVEMEGL